MRRIFLVGYMACGKSSTGKRLARALKLRHIDLDSFIESRYCKTVPQLFADKGEEEFRRIESKALHEVSDYEDVVISTGGGTACFFDHMALMNSKGVTVYLRVTPEELSDRLCVAKVERPLLRQMNQEELFRYIMESMQLREPFYNQAQLIVDADRSSSFDHISIIINKLDL